MVADTGERLTYGELNEASNRLAQLFRSRGLVPGDKIGVMLRNRLEFPIVYWAAQRSGLFVTLISTHLKPAEAAHILNDSGSKLLITATDVGETAALLAGQRAELIPEVETVFSVGEGQLGAAVPLNSILATMPSTPIADQVSGFYILYSSGTTGRPKGIVIPYKPGPIEEVGPGEGATRVFEGYDPLVAFNAGPLYHGAPMGGMIATHRLGGTVVTTRKFDALQTLKAIEDFKVVHAQFVPTMFVRLLALPEDVRRSFDLSSLKFVIHAAAPCPVEIKHRMIDWLGPIIYEYYGASENVGATYITPEEWLRKPGSVGRSQQGRIHICDEDGEELPSAKAGRIFFETPSNRRFSYLDDSAKTANARHPRHPDWLTVGDIGWVDSEGYLFLTDRLDFMIISGGVNIYPRAVEDALIIHPKVFDAAVIGVPHPEYGEQVKAIVQPVDWMEAGGDLSDSLIAWCRSRISAVSCPRTIEFVRELPRLASGKLAKHELRRLYGAPPAARS